MTYRSITRWYRSGRRYSRNLSAEELNASDEYVELIERIESRRTAVDKSIGDMTSDTEFVGAVREIMGNDRGADESSPADDVCEDHPE
jgi:predicted proteasome-type protease